MQRTTLLLSVLLVVASLPIAASATSANASVTDVTVSPSAPGPDEAVTFTPVIQNLQSSQSALEIEAVAIRAATDGGEYARVGALGTLSPGSSLEVSLTTTFEDPGRKNLRVIAYVHPVGSPDETTQIEYPVSFSVRDRDPQVDIRTNDSVEGVATGGTIRIANGLESGLNNVEVNVTGTGVELLDHRGVVASLPPGETATVPFRYRAQSTGQQQLTTAVSYTIDGSNRRTLNQSTSVRTEPLGAGAILTTKSIGSGPEQTVDVEILNPTGQSLQNVVVSASSPNATFDDAIVSSVPAGESRQLRLNTSVTQSPATAQVTATYEIGGLDASTNSTTELGSTAGRLTLTGLDVTREDDRWRISGSASNTGMSTTDSVIVSVRNTDGVDPAFPNKEYFVGTVPSSDFVSFDVYARTAENVSSVPLLVTYSIDGDRVEREFDVAVGETNATREPVSSGSGLESTVALGIGAVVTLAVGAVMVVGWRASRDDS